MKPKLVVVVSTLLSGLLFAACSPSESVSGSRTDGTTPQGGSSTPSAGSPKLLWMGDSIAAQLELPLFAAAATSEMSMTSIASDGGGNVAGPDNLSESTFDKLTAALRSHHPDIVAYQVSTYDWGTEKDQRAAYEKLLETVDDAGARLVLVTMPPIKADDFYADHMEALERTTGLVDDVADASEGKAGVFGSADVWGEDFQLRRDGELDRKPDCIHTCPQGAARFTVWFTKEFADTVDGYTAPDAVSWANAGWSGADEFSGCSDGDDS